MRASAALGQGGRVYRLRRPAKVGSPRPRHRTVVSWRSVFRHFTRRGGQPQVGRASMRSLGCCSGRGGRRQAEYVGDDGLGGTQHRGEQRGQVDVALSCGAYDAGEDLLGVGALSGAVAAAHLADDDGGPDGLFGAPVGGVDRRVPQEGEEGAEFDGQVRGEALGVVVRRRVVDQPAELGEQATADGSQTVVADTTGVAPPTLRAPLPADHHQPAFQGLGHRLSQRLVRRRPDRPADPPRRDPSHRRRSFRRREAELSQQERNRRRPARDEDTE